MGLALNVNTNSVWLVTFLLASLVMVSSCSRVVENKVERKWEMSEDEGRNLLDRLALVREEVFRLKADGKLPYLPSAASGGKFTIVRIEKNFRTKPFLNYLMMDNIKGHEEVYLAETQFDGRKLRYFFAEWQVRPLLSAAYIEENGEWLRIWPHE